MGQAVDYCFAADLGGTKVAAAIAGPDGRIIAEVNEPTDPRGATHVMDQILACAAKLAKSAGTDLVRIRHLTIGVPGAVDPRTARVSSVPHIAGIEDLDVLGYLRNRFGPAVNIENDVNLAMLGEHVFGRARGCRNAAFLALGTGTGLGLLLNDRVFRGATGAAGEIADLPVVQEIESIIPSPMRTLELEVGSLAIVERYRRHGGTAGVTVRDIFGLLESGDALASSILDTTARCVALAVVTLQSLLDLELIVFGGSIGLRPELHERIQRILPGLFPRPINIAPSELGDRAGIVGAAWAASRTLGQNSKAVK